MEVINPPNQGFFGGIDHRDIAFLAALVGGVFLVFNDDLRRLNPQGQVQLSRGELAQPPQDHRLNGLRLLRFQGDPGAGLLLIHSQALTVFGDKQQGHQLLHSIGLVPFIADDKGWLN